MAIYTNFVTGPGILPINGRIPAQYKTQNSPNSFVVVLIVVVLVAIVEVLVPRVVTIVLGRRPIVVFSETANTVKIQKR